MEQYFNISCDKNQKKFTSTLDNHASTVTLGEGLKDICLFLRLNERELSGNEVKDTGTMRIEWKEAFPNGDYTLLSEQMMIEKLNEIRDALKQSTKMDDKLIFHDYMLDEINDKINEIALSLEKNGKKLTLADYDKETSFIFKTIGNKIIPLNHITIIQQGFSFDELLAVMNDVYKEIPHSDKKHFHYTIDFVDLDFEEYM